MLRSPVRGGQNIGVQTRICGVFMATGTLDRVLSCPNLPSLPVVAAEVIELTSDPNVSIRRIAESVQRDQALAGKVLKTVNSSFYGLAKPCGSIERAMGYLGLNTVKSLVLGFSLVDMSRCSGQGGFDLMAHWRRAIVGAVSARQVAAMTGAADPEEAFLGGLFQDVGALACYAVLKNEYSSVIFGLDHADWEREEQAKLGLTHTQVGAELTKKWKLPPSIRAAVGNHHDTSRVAKEHQDVARVVAIGAMVSSVLSNEAPVPTAQQIRERSRAWFGDAAPDPHTMLEQASADARTLAKLFSQDIGQLYNTDELLATAQDKGLQHHLELQREAENLRRDATIDALTGLANRRSFDTALNNAFGAYLAGDGPAAVIFCDADRFKSVNDTHGHAAGDAILIQFAARVQGVVGDLGTVARFGGEEIAVVLPGFGTDRAAVLGEEIRAAIDAAPFDLTGVNCEPDSLSVTVSVGVASTDTAGAKGYESPPELLQLADNCVYEAKRAGRNRVIVHTADAERQTASAQTPTGQNPAVVRVLFVEDDPLAATLITTLLKRQKDVEIQWIESGTRARTEITRMGAGEIPSADVFLIDLNLPGTSGYELLQIVRANDTLRDKTFLVLSGEDKASSRTECMRLGATGFIPKQEFVSDIGRWVGMIVGGNNARAA